jgi:hypothetical protein
LVTLRFVVFLPAGSVLFFFSISSSEIRFSFVSSYSMSLVSHLPRQCVADFGSSGKRRLIGPFRGFFPLTSKILDPRNYPGSLTQEPVENIQLRKAWPCEADFLSPLISPKIPG